MSIRREGRELALQALYSADLGQLDGAHALERIIESFAEGSEPAVGKNSKALAFALQLLNGVLANRPEIDRWIADKSTNWTIPRMARIDLSILRLAVYELVFCPDIPKNVTLNEAIEIAKKFGAADSSAFINGILDEIALALPDKA